MLKKISHSTLLTLFMLLCSCVSEDDVFDEDFTKAPELTETSLIISFLNERFNAEIDDIDDSIQDCFSIKHPIQISYNTGQMISVLNRDGLKEIVNSQTGNFYINSLEFPLITKFQEQEIVIENTFDFNELFDTCNINTLKATLLNNVDNCFTFQYPITLYDSSQSEVTIENTIDFNNFIENEASSYVIDFEFPFVLNENETITNYFELYQVTNTCVRENCFDIFYETSKNDNGEFRFVASGHPESLSSNYVWSINDVIIESGMFEGNNNETFKFTFSVDDTYTVCASLNVPGCSSELIHCEEVIVDNTGCDLDIIYDFTIEVDGSYSFNATGHSATDTAQYNWLIDGLSVTSTVGNNSEFFSFNFPSNGTYEVCITFENFNCGAQYCEEIVVDHLDECLDISFEFTTDIFDVYNFAASGHSNTETANYTWSINNDNPDLGTLSGNNNEFLTFDFPLNGIYTVCVAIQTDDCSNEVEYCEDIVVESTAIGPVPLLVVTASDLFEQDDIRCDTEPGLPFNFVVNNIATNDYTMIASKPTSWFVNEVFFFEAETFNYTFDTEGEFTVCTTEECITTCRTFIVE